MAVSVLFVCLGNICRSPTAEGVFRRDVERAGLGASVQIDSAGTGVWHVGEAPDARAQAAARARGVELSELRARALQVEDFERFDHIFAMDDNNKSEMLSRCPSEYQHKIRLFLDLDESSAVREVPDPFYGEDAGFTFVLDLIEGASAALVRSLEAPVADRNNVS